MSLFDTHYGPAMRVDRAPSAVTSDLAVRGELWYNRAGSQVVWNTGNSSHRLDVQVFNTLKARNEIILDRELEDGVEVYVHPFRHAERAEHHR